MSLESFLDVGDIVGLIVVGDSGHVVANEDDVVVPFLVDKALD